MAENRTKHHHSEPTRLVSGVGYPWDRQEHPTHLAPATPRGPMPRCCGENQSLGGFKRSDIVKHAPWGTGISNPTSGSKLRIDTTA